MKHALAAILLAGALGLAGPARAQIYGQLNGAGAVPINGHLFGGYLTASQHVKGGLAQLRLSFHPGVDFGFQGGLTRLDPGPGASTRTTLRVGGDVRWQVAGAGSGSPDSRVDVAVGAALGIETADDLKVVSVGPTVVVSRLLGGSGGGGIVPYAGLAFAFSNRDAFGAKDTDVSLPLRLGLEARLSPAVRAVAELQLFVADRYNDDVGFAAGLNLPF